SSEDGGETWHNDDFSISPELKEVYHFDPMTAYDPVNGKMYAGALTTNFSGPDFKNIYIKSWDLNTDTHNGPFIQPINTDKVWMTTDNKGGLYMAEGLFKEYFLYSNDFGVSFEPVNTGVSGQISPYPEVDDSGCLHIIDYNGYKRCDGLGGFEAVDAPNTSLELFDMGDYLPGEFRALPLRLIAFHPNGQTFIIYTELAAKGSDQIAIWMSQSSDGIVWSTPWIISPDVAGDRFLPWFEIDQQGGIHVSYADTRNNLQPDNGPEAYVDMYYSYSNDLGQSWQETRVTPTPLEVPTLTWGGYFFGDYLEMALANSSTLYLAFPWFQGSGDMDMYVAKIQHDDLIFAHDFE
ncbi:MAG: sialidase family protein, partial [Marinicella sp.]